jgi:heme/copper-type cytochrome/quinol oxidase subunit 1
MTAISAEDRRHSGGSPPFEPQYFCPMRRPLLIVLLALGVVCAGAGVALVGNPFDVPRFGWTAYSPLSGEAYLPDVTWLTWAPRIGTALLAIGAGSTGAAVSALRGR